MPCFIFSPLPSPSRAQSSFISVDLILSEKEEARSLYLRSKGHGSFTRLLSATIGSTWSPEARASIRPAEQHYQQQGQGNFFFFF